MKEKIKNLLDSKIFSLEEMSAVVAKWKKQRKKIVFTNGCFDILHYGHLSYLIEGSRLGDKLILGLNSDASINKIKGITRPIIKLEHRARMLSAFPFINAVVPFDDETPISLIRLLRPDILFKGADYAI
ncbi:MAG TPA: hypothetical protein DEG63_11165, partial [Flavobacteriaceae bacterium]|nr:hypothetical protein [Flavobacteriaceae bacterium]